MPERIQRPSFDRIRSGFDRIRSGSAGYAQVLAGYAQGERIQRPAGYAQLQFFLTCLIFFVDFLIFFELFKNIDFFIGFASFLEGGGS